MMYRECSPLPLSYCNAMGGALIGSGTVLSHVAVSGKNIPANVVLHSLKLADGHFVTRIYGVADNPKEGTFLGGSMAAFGNVWDCTLV